MFGTLPTPALRPLNGVYAVNMKQNRTKTKDGTSSLKMTNGLTDVSDTDSTSSDRKLMNRSALICSSGKVFKGQEFDSNFKLNDRTNTRLTASAQMCRSAQLTTTWTLTALITAANG